jgi:hypothetical protein
LLKKLEFYGIEGFKTLIRSYLTGRFQRVVLDYRIDSNNSSKWERIKCGVPQDSILGPLFCLLYINDLPKITNKNNSMVLFADDTSIELTDINKLNFKINLKQTFKDINMWFTSNLLALNFDKTQYMEFRSRNYYKVTTQVNHGQISLKNATETKFLGLIMDDTFTWKQHIEYLKKKISLTCFALKNIKDTVSLQALRLIYFANVHSIISYAIIFWGDSPSVKKVFIPQKELSE